MAKIPIRDVIKTTDTPSGDEYILIDNGIDMSKATINSAVTPKATEIADDKIADLNLGTASQADVEDFATAAQGLLADSAVQPAREIIAGDGLTGGGDLSEDRTISLNSASIASLAKADTAVQSVLAGANVTIDATDPQNPIISASGGAASTDFATVADLLADDNDKIGYAGSGADTEVLPGDIITAQGFRYEVAASGATDAHVETTGGVNLRVLASLGCITPEQFGAAGDFDTATWTGTDDTEAFKAMASALRNNNRVVLSGVYRITDPVIVTASAAWDWLPGAKIINDCVDVPGAGEYPTLISCIEWVGSGVKYTASLAVDVNSRSRSFPVPDTSNISPGDIIFLRSQAILADTANATVRKGEWVSVRAVVGNIVHLHEAVYDDYLVSDDAYIEVRTPITGLRLNNPTVLNTEGFYLEGIRIKWFRDLWVDKGRFYNGEKGLLAESGIGAVFADCGAWDITEQQGYALQFSWVTNGRMIRSYGSNCRHLIEISGGSKYSYVIDFCGEPGSGAVVSWHAGPEENHFIGGTIPAGSYITMRGQRNRVHRATVNGAIRIGEAASPTPITQARAGENLQISGCTLRGPGRGGTLGGKISILHPVYDANITKNVFDIPPTSSVDNTATGCVFYHGGEGIVFEGNELISGQPMTFFYREDFNIPNSPDGYNDVFIVNNHGKISGPLFLQTSVDINGLHINGNNLHGTGYLTRLLSNNSLSIITGLIFENNRITGGFQNLTGTQTSDWGEIISRGNSGDFPSSWLVTTDSGGYVQAFPSNGERPARGSGVPVFICTPLGDNLDVSGYVAVIDRYQFSDDVLQSVRFKILDESGNPAGSGVDAIITRLK